MIGAGSIGENNKMSLESFWSKGALEEVVRCPYCGSKSYSHCYIRADENNYFSDVWHQKKCAECSSIFLSPRPDKHSIPRMYENYYTHGGLLDLESQKSFAWSLIHGYLNKKFSLRLRPSRQVGYYLFSCLEPLRLKLDRFGRHAIIKQGNKLLDVGCGNGDFLKLSESMGWSSIGLEPDQRAVEKARKEGLNVIQGDLFSSELDGQKFDFISASHVLEHVVDQKAFLIRLGELLGPNGRLYIAYPNPQSLVLSLWGCSWIGLHPPFHLSIPSKAVVKELLACAGCHVTFMRRGSHAINPIKASVKIMQGSSGGRVYRAWCCVVATMIDLLSTVWISPADELVILATKRH